MFRDAICTSRFWTQVRAELWSGSAARLASQIPGKADMVGLKVRSLESLKEMANVNVGGREYGRSTRHTPVCVDMQDIAVKCRLSSLVQPIEKAYNTPCTAGPWESNPKP